MTAQGVIDNQVYAIGIDVGGTKIAAGLVSLNTGRVLSRREEPTNAARGGKAVLHDTLRMAEELLAEAREVDCTVRGIGIGICELVDTSGAVTSAHTVNWRGMPIQERFARLAPTVVEADVRAHALAEARFGAGKRFDLFVFVTVGTGISSCLVQHGRPFGGARGNALVLASSPYTLTCANCGARQELILEEFAAGPALVTRYNSHASNPAMRGEEVLAAARAGEPYATEIVRSAGEALGVSIGWLVNVLDPRAIIIGGGLGVAGGLYWESLVGSTRAHIWADDSRDLPILMAELGPDAGLIGAAAATEVQPR